MTPEMYHNSEELEEFLQHTISSYPDITKLEIIGHSVKGNSIYALIISDNPSIKENEPAVRLTGSIHGNEYISGEILIKYAGYLTEQYAVNSEVKTMVDGRYIVIVPMLNPDGVNGGTRYNDNSVDLNRNFEEHWMSAANHGTTFFSEPESVAMRDFSLDKKFHLSATFHSGAVIVNMPFDYGKESTGTFPAENALVKHLGKIYSKSGTFLSNPDLLIDPGVDEGVINGGDWYVVNGSMQDWSYTKAGCIDYTIEVAKGSPETESGIAEVYNYHRDSITEFIKSAEIGIYGVITDSSNGNPIENASVSITGGDVVVQSDENGYYHKLLLQGTYIVTVSATGYNSVSQGSVVVIDSTPKGLADINLTPIP